MKKYDVEFSKFEEGRGFIYSTTIDNLANKTTAEEYADGLDPEELEQMGLGVISISELECDDEDGQYYDGEITTISKCWINNK